MKEDTSISRRTEASLDLLYTISRELAAQIDLSEVLTRILQLTAETMEAASGGILVLDESGEVIEGALIVDGTVLDHTASQLKDTVSSGLAGWVLQEREPALVSNTHDDERWMRREKNGVDDVARSAICVPLQARERLVGVLTMVHPERDYYGEDDLALLGAIADQAGIAVEKARLFTAERERHRLALTLQEVARTINSFLDPAAVFDKVLEQLARLVEYDKASIMLLENDQLRLVAVRGFEEDASVVGATISVNPNELLGKVLTANQPLVVEDAQNSRDWIKPADHPGLDDVHGWIGSPLVVRDSSVGVLNVYSRTIGAYAQAHAEVVTAFAVHAATAVANAQLFAETQSASRLYAGLFEDSIDPILITNSAGEITDVNVKAEKFLGFKREELFKRSIYSFHTDEPEDLPHNLSSLGSGETVSYVATLVNAEGDEKPVEAHTKRIDVARQPFLQWILRDISERLELDELRDDLTSMIFHDLRSPLANVISSLEVLHVSMPPDDETQRPVLGIAMRSSRRLTRLVDSLLDLARMDAGQDVLEKSEASLRETIEEAIEEIRVVAEARSHSVTKRLPKKMPDMMIDVDMIRRVMINLLENAIKFTPAGGKISVNARQKGKVVTVSVRDTGRGIPQEDQQQIFEKFTRAKYADRPKGLGLGLSFCKLAVEAHAGRIWVDSEPGKGSTFYFTLPV
jgi:PAS domain S-box-containing protein